MEIRETKLLKFFKKQGVTDTQLEVLGYTLLPVVTKAIDSLYLTAFSADELNNLNMTSFKNSLDPIAHQAYMDNAFLEKTGKKLEYYVEKYLDILAELFESHIRKSTKIVDGLFKNDPKMFISEFEAYMDELQKSEMLMVETEVKKLFEEVSLKR